MSPHISRLPDELLLQVFTISPPLTPMDHARLAATCSRFRRLAEDSTLWKDVSLVPFRALIDDQTVRILVRTRFAAADPEVARLQSLNLSGCSNITDGAIRILARGCPGLVRLDLTGCVKVRDRGLEELGKRCRRLRELNLTWCAEVTSRGIERLVSSESEPWLVGGGRASSPVSARSDSDADDDDSVWSTDSSPAAARSLLRTLDLTWCDRVTDSALEALGACCPHLESLVVSFGGEGITDYGIRALLSSSDDDDGSLLPYSHCLPPDERPLRVLKASMCASLTSDVLQTLMERAPKLETLVLTWCYQIDIVSVSDFRRRRPDCKVLFHA